MEREEFADFYAASFQRLVGQLYVMTGDQCEAQDAVQEAFVRAWARRGKIRTAAFTLVSNPNGTATLTINNNVLFEPGTLQRERPRLRSGSSAEFAAGFMEAVCSSCGDSPGWSRRTA